MATLQLAIRSTGLVAPVGLDAPSACAAIRARITNPLETRFRDALGAWVMGHAVPLAASLRGLGRLAEMAAMALDECLADVPADRWRTLPVLLCVAEPERPGREAGLDDQLFAAIEARLSATFSDHSAIVAHGRVGTAVALGAAERLLAAGACEEVVVVGVDSLLRWPSLAVYEAARRLLTRAHSDGFMPGECAGAVRLGRPGRDPALRCAAVGFAVEPAPLDSGRPLRGDGLSAAILRALADAGCEMHDMDHRIADLSGEQYYFKEATLALARTMRQRKAFIDLWHPAECLGEVGAAAGMAMLAVMDDAHRKGWAPGPRTLAQFANDGGARAAVVLAHGSA